jgi:MoaA/NifB/PqqE/SkfB family radical SAM enzyme
MKLLKAAKFFLKIFPLKIFGTKGPLTVIFNVTNRCNSLCKHCYAAYYDRDHTQEMTTAEAKSLIVALRENGCQRISFSGGEPLLREDIGELIDYVNSFGMGSTLNSNGILVPQRLPDIENVDVLAISLDGRPEHHDIFRGEGTAAKALEGLKAAVTAGIRVHTNTVLHKYNLEDIDYMLDLAKQYGFKTEFALPITNIFGEGVSADEIKPTNTALRNALTHIIQKKKKGAPILFSAVAYESVLSCWEDFAVEGVLDTTAPTGMPQCPAGKFFCLIDATGTLWACPHLIGKIESKNALDVGVAEAWRVATEHPCTGCYQVYHHEFSLLMDANPKVLWNYVKTTVGLA